MSNNVNLGKQNISIDGRFRLDVKADKKKFALTNINSFVPVGKTMKEKVRFLNDSGETDFLMIDRISLLFDPKKHNDLHNIGVFIQHPNVYIGGMSAEQHMELVRQGLKVDNPKFIITNVDKVEDDSFKKERVIMKVRAKLYDDDKPLSTDRLVWLCSYFKIPYKSDITEKNRYNAELTKRLDKFVQESELNAEKLKNCLDEMKRLQMIFYINELMEIGIVEDFSGVYKISDRPVGAGIDQVIMWYEQNNQIFLEHQKMIDDKLKKEKNLMFA